jgi:ubiquinone/menaquinone biosynthesis C-methylase UbiE
MVVMDDTTLTETPQRSAPPRVRVLDRLFAWWYPPMMSVAERAGQADVRRGLLAQARGRTLEIGVGSGLSLPHYPASVTELTMVEPDADFRRRLADTVAALPAAGRRWSVVDGDAHALPFEDESFDTVTASFTFCSVTRPDRALREVHRVLRPCGRFLFHEHVRGHGVRARLQDLAAPLQAALAGGCRPDRDFAALLYESPLRVEQLTPGRMPRSVPLITPVVHGVATRPAAWPAGPAPATSSRS